MISQCFSDGQFRFANISNSSNPLDFSAEVSARVEVCSNGIYGSVCDNGWDEADATVLCTSFITDFLQIPSEILCKFDSLFGSVYGIPILSLILRYSSRSS